MPAGGDPEIGHQRELAKRAQNQVIQVHPDFGIEVGCVLVGVAQNQCSVGMLGRDDMDTPLLMKGAFGLEARAQLGGRRAVGESRVVAKGMVADKNRSHIKAGRLCHGAHHLQLATT